MKTPLNPRSPQRRLRRFILTTTILPAALAASAFGSTDWNGAVPLDTGTAADDIHVKSNSTVTLANTGAGTSITETSISFEPAGATETLTVNGAGLTLRSLATILSIANGKTITINGTADFAPGALYVGPSQVTATDTGIILIKNGGSGALILDDPTNILTDPTVGGTAKATLKVFDGLLSIVGNGGTSTPISTLTTAIEIGTTGAAVNPVLRLGTNGTDTTFNNLFNVVNTGTIEHLSSTNDTLSGTGSINKLATGKTLTVNVAAGSLTMNGTIASTLNPNSAGGILKKMGVGTTLTLPGTVFVSNLNIAEGKVDVPGRFRTTTTPTFGVGTTLTLRNQSPSLFNTLPATVTVPAGATLEGLPGAFSNSATVQSTLSLTGGTLNLGIGIGTTTPGLAAYLYTSGWQAAQNAFGGPQFPANTYATYTNYFAGILPTATTTTSTGAGGVTELSYGGISDTAMFQVIAPAYTRTDDIVSRFKGKIAITTPGAYTFGTYSDDGSMLYIDGATVVSNNASQGQTRRTGTIALAPGLHDIDIGYYEGVGANGLVVEYTGPDSGGVQATIQNSVLLPLGESAPLIFTNAISVSQPSIINTGSGAAAGSLTLSKDAPLVVNGYQFDMGALTLTGGAGTYTINATTAYSEVCARSVTVPKVANVEVAVQLLNTGPGMLVLQSGASAQLTNAGSSVTSNLLGIVLGAPGGGPGFSPTGNATINVNGGNLALTSTGGNQSYAPVGMSFTNGGSISARKFCTGVAGTVGTPIRATLTPAITVNNGKTLYLTSQDNYILNVGAIGGGGSVSIFGGKVETSGAMNLTGTGQLTVSNSNASILAGASAGAIAVNDSTFSNAGGTLASGSTMNVTRSTMTSSSPISATGAVTVTNSTLTNGSTLASGSTVTVTDSTVTNGGTFASGSTLDVTRSTMTSNGAISATGAMTVTTGTVTANAGGNLGSLAVNDSKFINTGSLTTSTGISLTGVSSTLATLEVHGGSINGGAITGTGAAIHATTGVTTANTTATFTGFNPVGLQGRFITNGVAGKIWPGNTDAGILQIQTHTALAQAVLTSGLSFGPQGGADGVISTFFGGVSTEPTEFAMGFFGNFAAPVTGSYRMQTGIVDDDAGFWVDLDGNGVFSTTGTAGNELVAQGGCCGDGAIGTVPLVAGHIYKVVIAVEDGQGGSSLEGRIGLPDGSPMQVVNPSAQTQAGWWTYGQPNQVLVDVGSELDIHGIEGSVNVRVDGTLKFTGPDDSTFDSLNITAGGYAEVGGAAMAAAAGAQVPEPGALGLLLAGVIGCLTPRRRSVRT